MNKKLKQEDYKMSKKSLEERVRILEDIEEIRQLKARYMVTADKHDNVGYANTFTVDGVFECGPFGTFEGREALRGLKHPSFCFHMAMNPIIQVDGDNATGQWHLLEAITLPDKGPIWGACLYEDKYVRVNGEWKIKHSKMIPYMFTPYHEGWEKLRNCITGN
jgi:hypothetical protein